MLLPEWREQWIFNKGMGGEDISVSFVLFPLFISLPICAFL